MGGEHEGWGEMGGAKAERDAKDRMGLEVIEMPAPLGRSEQDGRMTYNCVILFQ